MKYTTGLIITAALGVSTIIGLAIYGRYKSQEAKHSTVMYQPNDTIDITVYEWPKFGLADTVGYVNWIKDRDSTLARMKRVSATFDSGTKVIILKPR